MAKVLPKQKNLDNVRARGRRLQRTFIRQWRKKKGLTQVDLADIIKVSDATISQIENGKTGYRQEYLEAIAEALDCTPADLLIRDPNDPEGIWSIWKTINDADRQRVIRIIRAALDEEVA